MPSSGLERTRGRFWKAYLTIEQSTEFTQQRLGATWTLRSYRVRRLVTGRIFRSLLRCSRESAQNEG